MPSNALFISFIEFFSYRICFLPFWSFNLFGNIVLLFIHFNPELIELHFWVLLKLIIFMIFWVLYQIMVFCNFILGFSVQFSSVQSLSRVQLFATPRIAARQASLSITISQSSLRLTSIKSVMPSSQLILCHPLFLPASESFPMSQLFTWSGQSTGASALASFLPKKSQGWSHSEWTGWISLQSKGLSRVFSNTTGQKHQFL